MFAKGFFPTSGWIRDLREWNRYKAEENQSFKLIFEIKQFLLNFRYKFVRNAIEGFSIVNGL